MFLLLTLRSIRSSTASSRLVSKQIARSPPVPFHTISGSASICDLHGIEIDLSELPPRYPLFGALVPS